MFSRESLENARQRSAPSSTSIEPASRVSQSFSRTFAWHRASITEGTDHLGSHLRGEAANVPTRVSGCTDNVCSVRCRPVPLPYSYSDILPIDRRETRRVKRRHYRRYCGTYGSRGEIFRCEVYHYVTINNHLSMGCPKNAHGHEWRRKSSGGQSYKKCKFCGKEVRT